MREVLGRAAEHRRAADVDHLDRLLLAHAVAADDLRERVEVDADEVERLDPATRERLEVVGVVVPREDARVDVRVQRLHPAAQQLRAPRSARRPASRSRPRLSRKAAVPSLATSSTPSSARPGPELVQAGLVVRGDQRALDHEAISSRTTLREQAVLDGLHARAQRVGGVVLPHRHALGADHRAGVDALVDVVHGRGGLGHAGGEHVLDRVRAREVGQRRRVGVDDPAGEAVEEARRGAGACSRRRRPARRRAPRARPPSRASRASRSA